MGVQISHCVHPEGSEEKTIWSGASRLGRGFSALGRTKRMPDLGRPFDARSRAYADIDPTEIRRVACGHVVGYIKGKSAI